MAKEMLFSVVCPTCEAKIGVHDQRLINQLVQCPKCGSIVQLTPPEGFGKSQISPQKTEDKPEKITPPPAASKPQPLSEEKDKGDKTPPKRSPLPVPPPTPVPVPPPASIPVPPPVSIPEPIAPNTLMPEPMSPGELNSNSASGGKSVSQRIGSLSEKMPYWTPYLVIGIGVIALTAMLLLFFLGGSKKEENNNSQPAAENSGTTQNKENEENVVAQQHKNTENIEDDKAKSNDNNVADDKSGKVETNEQIPPVEEKANNGEDLMPENEKTEESAVSEDKIDKNEVTDINNKSVENVENIGAVEDSEPQPENKVEEDNPFLEIEQKPSAQEPEQNDSAVENPVENKDDSLAAENDLTPDNISNNDSDPDTNSAGNNQTESELSSIPGLNIKLKSITIREQKLSQCLQTIRELGALPVEVNWDSLRRNGVNADDKISWSGKDVTVQAALTEVLALRGLMFKITGEDKIIFVPRASVNARSGVNSGEQGGSAMVKTQYSVSDLVGQSPEQTSALIKSIREFLCPGDWKEVGGTGTISASGGGSIMIMQSQHNQWIIADFLDRLRLARHLAPLYNRDASLEPMSVRAQSALKRNVGINFQPAADLKTALSEIGQRIGVNILLDEPSLKIAGISAQFPISFDARELSLEETFNRINEETGLVYLAQTPNSFIVTTSNGMKSMMSVEFYPISDLVNIGLTPAVLMEQIVKFEPKSWKSQDAASFGLVDYDANSDCLIVRQSQSVLSKISELLTQLRARLKAKE
ncbi:MAG: hypothetical protein IJH67_07355 [Thermoguttaceae bacterium]|nr:hypothetical protein [Thermoguttaceae bacterium]